MRTLTSLLFLLLCLGTRAANDFDSIPLFRYRITLRDKDNNTYSVDKPEQFLSNKAIERRRRHNIAIDEEDLPLSQTYVDDIAGRGFKVISGSKWNNTLLVSSTDSTLIDDVRNLDYVTDITCVGEWIYKTHHHDKAKRRNNIKTHNDSVPDNGTYGAAFFQIRQLNGIPLHNSGYRGDGMTIAIIDGGFLNADVIPAFKNTRIAGTKDMVGIGDDIFQEHRHGMQVLSCIGMNDRYRFVGTAPEASFWLIRSEETNGEQAVEEDNWAAAVEFADSVGADIINSSLGYSKFQNDEMSVKYHELDGKTHLISRTASKIASKGMILCNSAGNDGNKTWKKIGVPADANDILTVGAVSMTGTIATFSSVGDTQDHRVKPDICAMGVNACVMSPGGTLTTANGTSFSSPILTGLVACLWQALPNLNAYQIMDAIRQSGNSYEHPNNVYGYGIPDFQKAYNIGKEIMERQ